MKLSAGPTYTRKLYIVGGKGLQLCRVFLFLYDDWDDKHSVFLNLCIMGKHTCLQVFFIAHEYRENVIMRNVFVRYDVPTAVFIYIQICIASYRLPKT
jgi:hypothetical protein